MERNLFLCGVSISFFPFTFSSGNAGKSFLIFCLFVPIQLFVFLWRIIFKAHKKRESKCHLPRIEETKRKMCVRVSVFQRGKLKPNRAKKIIYVKCNKTNCYGRQLHQRYQKIEFFVVADKTEKNDPHTS